MGVIAYVVAIDAEGYAAARADPSLAAERMYRGDGVVDLDKAWDGILWVLSEDRRRGEVSDPGEIEAQAIMGCDTFDLRGEHYRGVPPDRVPRVAAALDALREADLRATFDPDAMTEADVYPEIWYEDEEAFPYVWEHFVALRKVFREAAKAGAGVLICLR